jgi:hypothetical protein
LLPIVRERAQLADSFTRRLVALDLERHAREAPDLAGYLAGKYAEAWRRARLHRQNRRSRRCDASGA